MDNERKLNLESLISEIDVLVNKMVTSESVDFKTWHVKSERFLIKSFGKDSYEHNIFKNESFSLSIFFVSTPEKEFIQACKEGLLTTKGIFLSYFDEICQDDKITNKLSSNILEKKFNTVFIVHGHDGELREKVARLLENQNIIPIILSEELNKSSTIIQKIEDNSNVAAAIALFTPDDEGRKVGSIEFMKKARQNVVFETGFLMGKIGREHVIILSNDEIDIPSDLSGVVYINKSSWEIKVLKELKAIGYSIDLNKLLR